MSGRRHPDEAHHRAKRLLYPAYQAGIARIVAGEPVSGAAWWPELAPLRQHERRAVKEQLAAFFDDARKGQEAGR